MVKFDLNIALLEMDLPMLHEDRRFVHQILRAQQEWIIQAALEDYKLVWEEASELEPIPHKKDNAGRRAANVFLRTVIWPSLLIKNAA